MLAAGIRCAAIEPDEFSVADINGRCGANPLFLGATSAANNKGAFDVVLLIEVVEHLYDNELAHCLAAARDSLGPGGVLIVTTPNNERRSDNFICSPESGLPFHRFQHVRSWSEASLADTLRQHGFRPIESGVTDFGASSLALWRTKPLFYRVARMVAKTILRTRPHLYAIARRQDQTITSRTTK